MDYDLFGDHSGCEEFRKGIIFSGDFPVCSYGDSVNSSCYFGRISEWNYLFHQATVGENFEPKGKQWFSNIIEAITDLVFIL